MNRIISWIYIFWNSLKIIEEHQRRRSFRKPERNNWKGFRENMPFLWKHHKLLHVRLDIASKSYLNINHLWQLWMRCAKKFLFYFFGNHWVASKGLLFHSLRLLNESTITDTLEWFMATLKRNFGSLEWRYLFRKCCFPEQYSTTHTCKGQW